MVFSLQEVKEGLTSFFDNLQVADLFLELFEMERNKSILDKQDFYFYFGDISFNNLKYPLFYIPVMTHRDGDTLQVEFDSQVYINKKAIEFIVQEFNVLRGTRGSLQSITERIIYLSQHQDDFCQIIAGILNELSHFFGLDSKVDFSSGELTIAKGASVRISNSCYICLFDKSDEALVNDYEEILQTLDENNGALAGIFNKLIENFIHKNPEPFNVGVEDEWDNLDSSDKLVYSSPIPLNSEQIQILSAVRKKGCNYIAVAGPPGTGKSHTITAIIFDAILKNQSVLVLSDKKEALDVVEDKITQTMNKVRYDKNFQNPILRLGKTGNTYSSILAQSAIDGIKTHYRAVKKDYEIVEETITKSINSLKDDLEAEILAYGDIDIKEIHEYFDLEMYFRDKGPLYDIEEAMQHDVAAIELGDLKTSLHQVKNGLSSNKAEKLFELIGITPKSIKTLADYERLLQFLSLTTESIQKIRAAFSNKLSAINCFSQLASNDLQVLQGYIVEYSKLKNWLFGYIFTKKQAKELDVRFKQGLIHGTLPSPHEKLQELKDIYEIFSYARQLGHDIEGKSAKDYDYITLAHKLLADEGFNQTIQDIVALSEDIEYLKYIIGKYPKTASNIGISPKKFSTIINNVLIDTSQPEYDKQIRYLMLKQVINNDFSKIIGECKTNCVNG